MYRRQDAFLPKRSSIACLVVICGVVEWVENFRLRRAEFVRTEFALSFVHAGAELGPGRKSEKLVSFYMC
jgi:hypothetical protein